MNKRTSLLIAGFSIAACLIACGKPEPQVTQEPAPSAEQVRQEQEAARRAQEATKLAASFTSATAPLSDLSAAVGSGDLPGDLEAKIEGLNARKGEAERLLAELQEKQGDGWTAARDQLQKVVDGFATESKAAQTALTDWRQREQAAIAARSQRLPIDPETGLIQGLDGGDYEPYLISVVERVQRRLRSDGLYAGPADGTFDMGTLEAVGDFQKGAELSVSGVPSPMTRSRLFAEPSPE